MKIRRILLIFPLILLALAGGLWAWKKRMSSSLVTTSVSGSQPSPDRENNSQQASEYKQQTVKAPVSTGATARKFIDMAARERRETMRQVKATDADELLLLFLDAGRLEKDPMKQSALQGKLTGALMEKKYAPDFIARMKRFVMDEANSTLERGLITSAFAGSRTKEGVEFVLWAATIQTEIGLETSALSNISVLGGSQPFLPEMIEPLWRDSKDANLIKVVAHAMARESAPSSIELLLSAAAAADGQDDMRRMAAIRALPQIYVASAVPPLVTALNSSAPGSPLNAIALSTLGQIGHKSAEQAVISWLQAADKSAAPLVAGWIGMARGRAPLHSAKAALNPSVSFRSEENREAIRSALATESAATIEIGPKGK